MPEPDLTDVQKAYNVAQSEMFQLAAYGHHRYHPLRESLTPEGKRQERDYNDRLLKAREDLEAGLLRLVAEHAERHFTGWTEAATWLRFLADDPGELSMLALRPDERDEETFNDWRAESMTAQLARAQLCAECDHPKDAHREGEDPVTPGVCGVCEDSDPDEAHHDYQEA